MDAAATSKRDGVDIRITSGQEETEGVEASGDECKGVTSEARKKYYGV